MLGLRNALSAQPAAWTDRCDLPTYSFKGQSPLCLERSYRNSGVISATQMPIRGYPKTISAQINVSTSFYGVDAKSIAGFITAPLERAIAQADGIDTLVSSSTAGNSQITANLRLNTDPYKTVTEIQSLVNPVANQLPAGAQIPIISIDSTEQVELMALGFSSEKMSPAEITEYLSRIIQPQLQGLEGVRLARIGGAQNLALRAWLDPTKLSQYGLTAADVGNALAANNAITGAGATEGRLMTTPLDVNTSLHSVEEFRRLVVRQSGAAFVRLSDVARVELGSDNHQQRLLENGKPAIFVSIVAAPDANTLDVAQRVRARFETLSHELPPGLDGSVVYDVTLSVSQSIKEVIKTLLESLAIVTIVTFLFLRRPMASLIPVITIPLSLVGSFGIMWCAGFSINLLTLLSLVLATGLVVDDAIIVVEVVSREIAEGTPPHQAALRSARLLVSPIIAMTIVLIAVYVPFALRRGLSGALFTEFAMTLAGAVTVSAVVALTLSPMMCSRLLKPASVERDGNAVTRCYGRMLRKALQYHLAAIPFGLMILALCGFLYLHAKNELAPQEDDDTIQEQATVPATATTDFLGLYDRQLESIYRTIPEIGVDWLADYAGGSSGGMMLTPVAERQRSTSQIVQELQDKASSIAGEDIGFYLDPSLPGASGLPAAFVIKSTRSFAELDAVSQTFQHRMSMSGKFSFVDRDLKYDLPEGDVVVDRDKAAALGLDMGKIGSVLNVMLSGGYLNFFTMDGRSYKVIPQAARWARMDAARLGTYTVTNINGIPVPLSSITHIENHVVPEQLNHFQQMNSATLTGVPSAGVSQAEMLKTLQQIAKQILPNGYATDTMGRLRQFEQESAGFEIILFGAMSAVYLALAVQFGNFRDPLIVMVSVPMSLAGALFALYLGPRGASLNIYSEVGLVTLMGLISKHGILLVQVANRYRSMGVGKVAAIEQAALLRLRPILMTTTAMILGVVPLLFAHGPGAESRFAVGLTLASGLSIGTVFTLFVVPSFYLLLADRHREPTSPSQSDAGGLSQAWDSPTDFVAAGKVIRLLMPADPAIAANPPEP